MVTVKVGRWSQPANGTLSAGNYTLVVGGFNTIFGATLGDITAGSSSGDYGVEFASVPEPFTILGSVTAIGMGAALKKKYSKSLKGANSKA